MAEGSLISSTLTVTDPQPRNGNVSAKGPLLIDQFTSPSWPCRLRAWQMRDLSQRIQR